MKQIKSSALALFLGLAALGQAHAANYCIAVNGGFGNGGTSFVGKGFALPAAGNCKPWAGYTKTSSTVIAASTGAGCLSSNGKVFTLTVFSTDPPWFGTGQFGTDHIRFCPAGVSGCPIGAGTDVGSFGPAAAVPQTCTSALLNLPALHD